MTATRKSQQDTLKKLINDDKAKKTAVYVRSDAPHTPYLLDTSNPRHVKSWLLEKESHVEKFNLFADILTREVDRVRVLEMGGLEA